MGYIQIQHTVDACNSDELFETETFDLNGSVYTHNTRTRCIYCLAITKYVDPDSMDLPVDLPGFTCAQATNDTAFRNTVFCSAIREL